MSRNLRAPVAGSPAPTPARGPGEVGRRAAFAGSGPAVLLSSFVLILLVGCSALSFPLAAQPTASAAPTIAAPAASPTSTLIPLSGDEWIAFVRENNVWLIHPDGSGAKRITDNPPSSEDASSGEGIVLKWSPDGRMLAFSQLHRLYVAESGTGAVRVLVEETAGGFDWAPDGTQIIYDAAAPSRPDTLGPRNTGLWVVSVKDGSQGLVVPSTDEFAAIFDPLWSPDGERLLVSRGADNVELTGLGTGAFTSLVPGGDYLGGACYWSPIESTIACRQFHEELGKAAAIRFYDEAGQQIRESLLPDELRYATLGPWSPDGTRLSLAGSSGSSDLYNLQQMVAVLTVETDEYRVLAPGRPSSWSPDGQWIAADFLAWPNALNRPGMQVINTISGESFPLADGIQPVWQPSAEASDFEALSVPTPLSGTPLAQVMCTTREIDVRHTDKGDYLQMCANGDLVEVGPLARGAALMGPNGNFFVYCSFGGGCFAARLGATYLTPIGSVKYFSAIQRNREPVFQFEFIDDHPYTLLVRDLVFGQKEIFRIPTRITNPD